MLVQLNDEDDRWIMFGKDLPSIYGDSERDILWSAEVIYLFSFSSYRHRDSFDQSISEREMSQSSSRWKLSKSNHPLTRHSIAFLISFSLRAASESLRCLFNIHFHSTMNRATAAIVLNFNSSTSDRRVSRFGERLDLSLLLRRIAGINVVSVSCTSICIGFDLVFSVIALGMGAAHQGQCSVDQRIPIYPLIFGLVNLFSLCLTIFASIVHYREQDQTILGFYSVITSALLIILFQLFNFIWVICASVWVFSVYERVQYTDPTLPTFCKEQIYQYTLVTVILQYVFPLVICCCKNIPFDFWFMSAFSLEKRKKKKKKISFDHLRSVSSLSSAMIMMANSRFQWSESSFYRF